MQKLSLLICCLSVLFISQAQDTVKTYWRNNQLMSQGIQKAGVEEGVWTYYHYNGTKWSEGEFKDGQRVGIWKSWFDDGKLNQEYNAVTGPSKVGIKTDKWNLLDRWLMASAPANGHSIIPMANFSKKLLT